MSRTSAPPSKKLAGRDADAVPAYLRLMEIGEEAGDWEGVARNARRMLAVNPLVRGAASLFGSGSGKTGHVATRQFAPINALLLFDTTDPAETHFRLAQLLREAGERDAAKRHVLMALEDAPRFLAAHQLLLELDRWRECGRRANAPLDNRTGCHNEDANTHLPIIRRRAAACRHQREPGPAWPRPRTRRDRDRDDRDRDDRAGVPMWENDAGFKNDVFTFVRDSVRLVAAAGDGGRRGVAAAGRTDYPDSDLNFSFRCSSSRRSR